MYGALKMKTRFTKFSLGTRALLCIVCVVYLNMTWNWNSFFPGYVVRNEKQGDVTATQTSDAVKRATPGDVSAHCPNEPYLTPDWNRADTVDAQAESVRGSKRPWRILCYVQSNRDLLRRRALLLKYTWTRRCDVRLFVVSQTEADERNRDKPDAIVEESGGMLLLAVKDGSFGRRGKEYLSNRNEIAWQYIYDTYRTQADFFLRADDDTYVVMQNLRAFLADKDPRALTYYGHMLCDPSHQMLFMSGGGGYVLTSVSLEAMVGVRKRPISVADKDAHGSPHSDTDTEHDNRFEFHAYADDVADGRDLRAAGVLPFDSRDRHGRERFLHYHIRHLLTGVLFRPMKGDYHLYEITRAMLDGGHTCCSSQPIALHYITGAELLLLEWSFYHQRVAGAPASKETGEDWIRNELKITDLSWFDDQES